MKIKEYYNYKQKFVKKSERKKVEESQGIVYIKTSLNNIFVSISDLKGKVNYLKSSGSLGFKSARERRSKQAYEIILKEVTKELVEKKWFNVFILFKGLNRRSFKWLRYLNQGGIKVKLVKDVTRLPYNGCRLKKERRG